MAAPRYTAKPTYHERQLRQNPDFKEVELMCLSDGSIIPMLDDGPFRPGAAPNIGRQRIIALVKKRTEPDSQGNSLPLYVATKPGLRIWDPAIEQMRDVPVMTPELEKLHKELLAIRAENIAGGDVLMKMQQKRVEEAQAATRATVVEAMAEVFAASKTPPKKQVGAP